MSGRGIERGVLRRTVPNAVLKSFSRRAGFAAISFVLGNTSSDCNQQLTQKKIPRLPKPRHARTLQPVKGKPDYCKKI